MNHFFSRRLLYPLSIPFSPLLNIPAAAASAAAIAAPLVWLNYPCDFTDDSRFSTAARTCCLIAQVQEQYDWRDTSHEFVSAMRGMTKEALLECPMGLDVPAAEELRVEREESLELQAASRKALEEAA